MSDEFLTFTVADVVGAVALLVVSRVGWRYPWAWSVAAWAATAAIAAGLVPANEMVPTLAMAVIIGVGLITPIVGLIAIVMLLASPALAVYQLWDWWRRRRGVASPGRARALRGAAPLR